MSADDHPVRLATSGQNTDDSPTEQALLTTMLPMKSASHQVAASFFGVASR
ncbi:MAG: hypothetical protein AAFP15_15240 [Bacteroidota bacterium]